MKVQYLGTGAAEGIPAVFCGCDFCRAARAAGGKMIRTRSQVMIDGILSVDFPPDAYMHSLVSGTDYSALRYILFTHSHMDHCYTHDFILRGYKYARLSADRLDLFGNAETQAVFSECTRREMKGEVSDNIFFNVIEPYREYFVGEYRLLTVPACHTKEEDALLFYIERGGKGYLHLYDSGPFPEDTLDFLEDMGAKASLISFDCTFVSGTASPGERHMGIGNDTDVRDALVRRGICTPDTVCVITHFSHNGEPYPEKLAEIGEKYGVTAAYDGMTVTV